MMIPFGGFYRRAFSTNAGKAAVAADVRRAVEHAQRLAGLHIRARGTTSGPLQQRRRLVVVRLK
jgi:hypothetical protein